LAAIEAASWDLPVAGALKNAGAAGQRRHLIILSDGRMRTGTGDSTDSTRQAQLKKRVADLAAAGFVVHAVQLPVRTANGNGSEAEAGLLRQMALATGGVYLPIRDSQGLSAAFARVFQTVARPQTIPVRGDGFQVDAGVEEITAFRPRGGSDDDLRLVDPQGNILDRARLRPGVRWHEGAGYDLVTVHRPVPGSWHFAGAAGPAARVYAVGDLELELQGIPATVFPGMLKTFELQLTNRGRPVSDPDFLALLQIRAVIAAGQGPIPVLVDDRGAGRYQLKLLALEEQGEHEVRVQVTGPTFSRELVAAFTVRNPVALSILPDAQGTLVWLELNSAEVDYQGLVVSALARQPPAAGKPVAIEALPAGLWKMRLPEARGALELTIDIEGNYLNQSPFRLQTEPIVLSMPLRSPLAVNLDLSGTKLAGKGEVGQRFRTGTDAPVPAPARPGSRGALDAATASTRDSSEAGDLTPAREDSLIPLWFAALLAVLNLAVGLSVWLLLKVPEAATAFLAEVDSLRSLFADPTGAESDESGEPVPVSA
ncbi:MAG: hypothetical protein KDI31_18120, partial [Pseudomonadales bacterium]|nr:hypothetical protein [Pseudomonadales bacterium]